ncbi:hypothetical protein PIROE2DRAFT_12328, partial [Piromyces sp. E2]
MADVEQKVEEVKNTVEEKVEEVEEGAEVKRSMLESIAYTIFNEGIDDNILLLVRCAFVGLFLSLIALLFITHFSIHIFMLIFIATALCITLE